jgi:flavin reductase (DIM6/NTAB) family NADH-FMN oxidoreductase RutF
LLEPGPVVMVTTVRKGRPNIMTLSWHMMMEFEPPLVGCVLSNRNFSFEALRETKECVINIPAAELAKKVVGCGNTSGRAMDKFKRFGLTAENAACVDAPLIRECFANLECKLVDERMVERYCFFVLQVVKARIDPRQKRARTLHHCGRGVFVVDGKRMKLRSKMT